MQTHLESSSQCSILVQFEVCSERGIAILSNSITCNYSFRHITSDLYRESGSHENKGRTLLQNFQVSQVTSRNTCAELRNTFRRMYLFQNRENPMTVRMKFIRTGKLVAVTIVLIFESLAFHSPLLNKLKQIEKKKFDD